SADGTVRPIQWPDLYSLSLSPSRCNHTSAVENLGFCPTVPARDGCARDKRLCHLSDGRQHHLLLANPGRDGEGGGCTVPRRGGYLLQSASFSGAGAEPLFVGWLPWLE